MKITSFLVVAAFHSFLIPPCCLAATYYVATNGNDQNSGSANLPYRTLQKAADSVSPGDTVIVRDGNYTTGNWTFVDMQRAGTSSAWITFKAEHQGGAVLDGQNNGVTKFGFSLSQHSSFMRMEGFEIKNLQTELGAGALMIYANNVLVTKNKIHDIGRVCLPAEIDAGITGMYIAFADSVTVEKNVIHDVGRFGTLEDSDCNTGSPNHDHGIYVAGATNLLIKNNVIYQIPHGWGIHFYNSDGKTQSSGVTVANNTLAFPNADRDGLLLLSSPGLTNAVIENNIFYRPTTAGINVSTTAGPTSYSNVSIANNLTFGGASGSGTAAGVTFAAGNLGNTDPRLVNPDGFDFHLQSGSPAIDAGMTVPQVTDDYEGNIRPQGARFDIGADERLATNSPPSAPRNLKAGQ